MNNHLPRPETGLPKSEHASPSHPIRLLAVDLDDTLLNDALQIGQENQRALAVAEAAGVQVVLASGRAPAALSGFARTLGMDQRPGYLITFNGGLILASDTGRTVWGVSLEPALLAELWELAAHFKQPIETYGAGGILVNLDNDVSRLESEHTGLALRVVDRTEFCSEARVKIILPGEPRTLDQLEARFKEVFEGRANIARSKEYLLEAMPAEADKGLALARIAARLGLVREQVMAVGDSWNDEGMLRWAGVAVAMANGAPGIRRLAGWVTTRSNNQDGLAEAVDRYVLS